jgi:predicted ATPase
VEGGPGSATWRGDLDENTEKKLRRESQDFGIRLYSAQNTDEGQEYSTEIQSEIQSEKPLRLLA